MNPPRFLTTFGCVLTCFAATAQTTIFNQNFDGGYTGGFSTAQYGGGSPSATSTTVLGSGGNPNGCLRITMTTTTGGDYYAGQVQLTTVSGNSDSNPADYILSFDANGSQAGNIQFVIETWPNNYFGGTGPVISAVVNEQLTAANTWQTFHINLGNVTTAEPTGATWQLSFQIGASQWGGAGQVDTLTIDNIVLTHLANNLVLSSSASPSAYGAPVSFTALVVTNGVAASNATGQVVFSYAGGPFSTNTLQGGGATSLPLANIPVGSNPITGVYSGGNYPASTNTFSQLVSAPAGPGIAQSNLLIYADSLLNGFQSWSWAAVNFQTLNPPPHSGVYSISVTDRGNDQALALHHSAFSTTPYASLSFWINGATGGQRVQVSGLLDDANQVGYSLPALSNGWQQITIPLSALGVANKPNCTGFWLQGSTGTAQAAFYVDDVQFVAAPPPALVHVGVDAAQVLSTVDTRQFGLNTATWDGILGDARTLPLLQAIGCQALRWPGGSTSDGYHWASDAAGNATFQSLATNLGAQVFTTVNYGSGTAAEAAAWVLYANKTNNCGFKYWEVGNECYGSWEYDTHAIPQDPYTYATTAVAYIQQMKSAYPAVPIKVGVVVVPGEGSFSNNATHFVVNPRTGTTNFGWTPVVLATMKSLGVLPDFLIHHSYPQYTPANWTYYADSPDSDPLLLQVPENPSPSTFNDWAGAAADLRQQITDYVGAPGTNIELCVTENNCDAGSMGRQSTSLVNALYLADSTCQLMTTEFRSYLWWDLHNGADTSGDLSPSLYGWRLNGDYGVLDGSNSPYPTFYAKKLLQYYARPGDSVLNGTSDYPLLTAHATRGTNGSLSLMVVNKHLTTSLAAQIGLTNFTPWTTATIRSYGIPQDTATETNGPAASQDLATNSAAVSSNFAFTFPPLSMTLFTFAPAAPKLAMLSVQPAAIRIQLQGQAGATYVLQTSTNLISPSWISVSTNQLVASTAAVSLPISAGARNQFFRAVWMP